MSVFPLKPSKKLPDNWVLFTKSGLRVKVFAANPWSIQGTIKGENYHWFDTGNYIGSNYPHPLDIDWEHSWNNYKKWKQRKEKAMK